jgi:DNA-binding HxlR family transcriptional regulator
MNPIAQRDPMQSAECDEEIAAQAETGGSALIDGMSEAMSMLIVRDALAGCRRPAEFQRRLGLSEDMIVVKLDALVETRILERHYSSDGIGPEYVLTNKGRELEPVLQALSRWGRKHVPIRNAIPK